MGAVEATEDARLMSFERTGRPPPFRSEARSRALRRELHFAVEMTLVRCSAAPTAEISCVSQVSLALHFLKTLHEQIDRMLC